jgi:hypothetical protein
MKYRDHKGGLAESMETVQTGMTTDSILKYLNGWFNQFGFEIEEIEFHYTCYDHRINWDTYNVCIRMKGDNFFTVAGQMALDENEYCCAGCKKVFIKGRSDQEAAKESIENFGAEFYFQEKQLTICDDCYKICDPKNNPEIVEKTIKEFNKKRN